MLVATLDKDGDGTVDAGELFGWLFGSHDDAWMEQLVRSRKDDLHNNARLRDAARDRRLFFLFLPRLERKETRGKEGVRRNRDAPKESTALLRHASAAGGWVGG